MLNKKCTTTIVISFFLFLNISLDLKKHLNDSKGKNKFASGGFLIMKPKTSLKEENDKTQLEVKLKVEEKDNEQISNDDGSKNPFDTNADSDKLNPFVTNADSDKLNPFVTNADSDKLNPFETNSDIDETNEIENIKYGNKLNPFGTFSEEINLLAQLEESSSGKSNPTTNDLNVLIIAEFQVTRDPDPIPNARTPTFSTRVKIFLVLVLLIILITDLQSF